jgi:glycolate oxidase iron-sulfur subunit
MQTSLTTAFLNTSEGQEADAILRSCVHCGFCTATCPTYQLLGDELDGPRGRIYLIKQMLEGQPVTRETQRHLDRCLTCRACETTCPSGVRYGRLADIGRAVAEQLISRPWPERFYRRVLRAVIPYATRFGALLRIGQVLRPALPAALRRKIPAWQASGVWPLPRHPRRMLVLAGCAQSNTTPNTNAAAARVLDRLGISLIVAPAAGCCGALSHHLSADADALNFMRQNIDAWWPLIEPGIESGIDHGIEAIVMTASGCGVMVKDYGALLKDDTTYAAKAAKVSSLTRDLSEILATEDLSAFRVSGKNRRIAFHAPCTLQHGQKLTGVVESILMKLGFELTEIHDGHLCCGSAGSYSLLQPALSIRLRDNKLNALQAEKPELIATANVGCQLHLATGSNMPVLHWIELLDTTA